ncbi:MAG: Gfo/Idh/MocA family oxidoreductase [Clostridiales bacterium]|jgi:predicted dehydrogenase|nr:Gfo/Idh/MocA family oxidoreductase [Clostridiales bacterium]
MIHKMAIIGLGGMGTWHYENIKEKIPEIEVVAAYDIRKEAKASILEKGLKLYGTPQDLYSDKEIELVLVSTPNDTHMPYAINSLKSGKNVISEKPVTLDSKQLKLIIDASEEAGKFFTVHQNRRWDNDYLTMKEIFKQGLLSDPYIIESRVQGSRQSLHGWRGYKENGGGMVLDWGVHLVDQMLNFAPGKLMHVTAHLHQVFAPEVDDNFMALFRFENGLTYLIEIAMNCFVTQPRWHISCKDGTAVIEDWDVNGKIVRLADSAALEWGEDIVYTAAGPTRSMAPRPKETSLELSLPVLKSDWAEYYHNIAAKLEGRAELIVTTDQAMRVMRTIDAIFESDKSGTGVWCGF